MRMVLLERPCALDVAVVAVCCCCCRDPHKTRVVPQQRTRTRLYSPLLSVAFDSICMAAECTKIASNRSKSSASCDLAQERLPASRDASQITCRYLTTTRDPKQAHQLSALRTLAWGPLSALAAAPGHSPLRSQSQETHSCDPLWCCLQRLRARSVACQKLLLLLLC